ncbi:MAG TPA: polysaccharide biosynthesis tyrosine autokinase [Acidobacteriaceae bacterium]|nr:polysaccharide biosynthesis tyrosine autokinase [Acidobacteriaceae bacterium]
MSTFPEKEPSLRDLLRIFHRRRTTIFVVALSVFALAVCACVVTTRRYTASSIIQLEKSSSDSLGLDSLMGAASGGASDALSVNIDLQTQADILQSEGLALKVIKDLDLEHNEDFKSHFSPIGWLVGLVTPHGPSDPVSASLEDSPGRRRHMVQTFHGNLNVKVTAGTRLLEVSYTNHNPKIAAAVVNDLVQALIDYTFQTKFTATNEVSHWLEGQLGDLRKQSEELQSKVVALQQGSGIFGVGGTDPQGKPVIYSPVLDRLQQSTAQLSQAQMNRVLKASIAEVVKTGNPEMISQLSGTSLGSSSSPGVANSLTLIQNLRLQEATLQSQIDQDASQFGPAYPKLIQERASMKGVQQSLRDEIMRIGERAQNDLQIASRAEQGSQAAYDRDRSAAEKLNDKSIEYAILSKEADQSQELYQDLLKRLKEAGILEGLHSSNVTVVDRASTPAAPSKPRVPLYLALGMGMGIFFGCCAALLVDAVDNKIQGTEEIEALQIPVLGIAPQIESTRGASRAIVLDSRHSAFGEAVRGLRSGLLISRSGKPPQVMLISSANPGEGKSTLALNLAASLAQFDKKVLLLEADMRRPVLRRRLGLDGSEGLSVLLSDHDASEGIRALPGNPNLYVLPGGPVPPYPSELLGSQRMQSLMEGWRGEFDFIVIDSPPALPVTDSQILAQLADATVLLARVGYTTRPALERAYKLLLMHRKDQARPAIGVLLNFVSTRSAAYYGYYGYYGGKKYEYHQG